MCRGKKIIVFAYILALLGCGAIKKGDSSSGTSCPNEETPSGTVQSQGTFSGVNNQTVSGIARIYISSGTFVLRIESITFPQETGLQLVAQTSTGATNSLSVKCMSGNQNYPLSAEAGSVWSSITLKSITKNMDYGTATLTAVSD